MTDEIEEIINETTEGLDIEIVNKLKASIRKLTSIQINRAYDRGFSDGSYSAQTGDMVDRL